MSYPGQEANQIVRVLGVFEIIAATAFSAWILAQLDSSIPPEFRPIGVAVSFAVFLNGLLAGMILILFAGMGDNIIHIRSLAERFSPRSRDRFTTHRPAHAPGSGHAATGAVPANAGPVCASCGSPLDPPSARFCTNCGAPVGTG
jgi:hypothetical protein